MPFRPKEILFSPTSDCNLSCPHCSNVKSKTRLSRDAAIKFLHDCKKIGIKRIGFTGGEPFLALDFLCEITAAAVREGFLFDKIMTNAVWYKNEKHLRDSLTRLFESGYDGDICVSVDAFHRQDLEKVARFIRTGYAIWRRPDIVSIACVHGCHDKSTTKKLESLSWILKGRRKRFFIKMFKIDLSPIGNALRLKDPWDGHWFKEDHCKGPGDVFFVTPSGDVKPCCGYTNELAVFTIGSIRKDSPQEILKNFSKNNLLCAIFNSGLSRMRKRLEELGIAFPGKTSNHCYFCRYILTEVPKCVLEKCLSRSIS